MKALRPTFDNRAGKVGYILERKKSKCSYFLEKLNFRHNGDLVLCCADYNYDVVFGNVMEQPLAQILNSELYRKYWYAHKERNGKQLPLCRDCNVI